MDLSALNSGCRPPSRSMMDRRRCPRMACESDSMPSPSGPRWRRACSMACIPLIRTGLSPTIPAIPHMLVMLPARSDGGFKHPLIAFRATLDEKVLDPGKIVAAHGFTTLRRVAQGLYGLIEGVLVIQLDVKSRFGCAQEIGLAALVVADHRQSE